ncbi:MAG: AMP-binding protein [Planctomycetota bacterium]|jgi:acyl-CoA synthetase (AMP-forming)/AMP-acid ligase II|nr:AMP-binding protein [Planctomycetota bacterium]
MSTPTSFTDLLAQQARIYADKPFLIDPLSDSSLTFQDFAAAARGVADQLQAHGLKRGDRVLLVFPNGAPSATSFLGVWLAGGVAVPVNPAGAARETAFLRENSGAGFVLAADPGGEIEGKLPGLVLQAKPAPGTALYRHTGGEAPGPVPPGLALILYTSGTTGLPKGVMLSEENLLAEAGNICLAHQLTPEDKALCLLPFYHINGLVVTLLTPLLVGLSVVLPPRFSASRFWDWVSHHRVRWFSAVPTIYSILLGKPFPRREDISELRFMRSASAALPPAILAAFEEQVGVPLIESYGISEGGSQITSNPLPPLPRKAGSVGIPFGNEIRVLLPDGNPAPQDRVGEVVVRGANIASGYFANPQETAKSFRAGWFHTGDLGCFDADGYLFLRGRAKELINRAGEMISPREIDDVLYLYPEVEMAAAVGVPHPLYGEEIVAFVRLREDRALKEAELQAFCRERLSAFKVPRRFYPLVDFPRGPSGKIQRLKLVDTYQRLPEKERLP